MAKIRMIASDIDGTLLFEDETALRPETCELIARLIDAGIGFSTASGRQYKNLRKLFAPVKDQISYVTQNGCVTIHDGRMIDQRIMDSVLGRKILLEIAKHREYHAMATTAECAYAEKDALSFLKLLEDVVQIPYRTLDRLEEIEVPYSKISMFEEEGLCDTEYWQELFGRQCTVVPSARQWLDFFPSGVSKAWGLSRILELTGISPEEVIVFGDNDNDLELFDLAGCAVTVPSAKKEIQERADAVTDLVEHAFAEILDGRRNTEDWKK